MHKVSKELSRPTSKELRQAQKPKSLQQTKNSLSTLNLHLLFHNLLYFIFNLLYLTIKFILTKASKHPILRFLIDSGQFLVKQGRRDDIKVTGILEY